jgi:drug/metabolite transporter (DMT)-like permease
MEHGGPFHRSLALDPFSILLWRGTFGGLGLLGVLLLFRGPAGLRDFARMGRIGWLYAGISATGMITLIVALKLTSVAHVAIIYATVPFLAAGLGWVMLRDPPGRAAMVASALALAGAAISVGFGHEGDLVGDLLALVMTATMALLMVLGRKHPGIPTLAAATASSGLAALVSLPFALTLLPGASQMLVLAGFGLANSAVGIAFFLLGSARIRPVETALIGALDAPLAPLWVLLVFAEVPSPATLLGGAVVLAAVVGHILHAARKAPGGIPGA